MNIILCGQKMFGSAVLLALIESGHNVVKCYAPRVGEDSRPDRLHRAAARVGVPVGHGLESGDIGDGVDLIIAAHSWDFISQKALDRTRHGGIGYHPSLLPLRRGRDAVKWTIHCRDDVTGGSVYWLTSNIDAGPIAARELYFIKPDETVETLWRGALFPIGVGLITTVVDDISRGVIIKSPQPKGCGSWEPSMDRPPVYRPELLRIGGDINITTEQKVIVR